MPTKDKISQLSIHSNLSIYAMFHSSYNSSRKDCLSFKVDVAPDDQSHKLAVCIVCGNYEVFTQQVAISNPFNLL